MILGLGSGFGHRGQQRRVLRNDFRLQRRRRRLGELRQPRGAIRLQGQKDDLLSNAGETTEHLREDTTIVPAIVALALVGFIGSVSVARFRVSDQ